MTALNRGLSNSSFAQIFVWWKSYIMLSRLILLTGMCNFGLFHLWFFFYVLIFLLVSIRLILIHFWSHFFSSNLQYIFIWRCFAQFNILNNSLPLLIFLLPFQFIWSSCTVLLLKPQRSFIFPFWFCTVQTNKIQVLRFL